MLPTKVKYYGLSTTDGCDAADEGAMLPTINGCDATDEGSIYQSTKVQYYRPMFGATDEGLILPTIARCHEDAPGWVKELRA